MCYFAACLVKERLKHHIIQTYLSVVCFLHIFKSHNDPFQLCVEDIGVDNPEHSNVIRISIKLSNHSKRGGFVCGGTVEIFSDIRGMALGLPFGCRHGTYLTQKTFVRVVRQELETAGMDQSHYCSHSFRIGAVTTKQHSVPAGIPKDQLTFYSRILGAQDHSADN